MSVTQEVDKAQAVGNEQIMICERGVSFGYNTLVSDMRALPIIAVENTPQAVPLETYPLPRRCLLLFGQEGPGLTPEALAAADATVDIAQFGSTRSMNAGAAAAIAMHAWVRAHVFGQRPHGDSSRI